MGPGKRWQLEITKKGAKAERYVQLDPDVLVGIANFQNADEVRPKIRVRVAREVEAEPSALDDPMEAVG
jgi:hypothetical protein